VTNRELLCAPRDRLSPADRQRQHVLRTETAPVPCPACKTPVDAVTAAGLDVDRYPFNPTAPSYKCPHCGAALEQLVPLAGPGPGWHWELESDWLADRLRKAALYYGEQHKEES
jgi:endogenous inhibitor of DNA gyrase (YacG/DUF329 family)